MFYAFFVTSCASVPFFFVSLHRLTNLYHIKYDTEILILPVYDARVSVGHSG